MLKYNTNAVIDPNFAVLVDLNYDNNYDNNNNNNNYGCGQNSNTLVHGDNNLIIIVLPVCASVLLVCITLLFFTIVLLL